MNSSSFKPLAFLIAVGFCSGVLAETAAPTADAESTAYNAIPASESQAELIYRILLAEVAGKRGKLGIALENYRAAALASDDPRLAERAVGIALFMEEYPVALEIAERWFELDKDNPRAQQTLILSLLRNERLDAAVEQFNNMLQSSEDGNEQRGFERIVLLLRQLKDDTLALRAMQAVREANPQSRYAHYYYAVTALGAEQPEQALAGLDTALALAPDWGQAHLLRSQILQQQGDVDSALESLAKAVAAQPDDEELRMGYARLLVAAERLEEAHAQLETLAEQLLSAAPKDAENIAQQAEGLAENERAMLVETLYYLGLLASEDARYDAAEGYFRQLLALKARITDVYFELGRLEELRENYSAARDWYAKVNDEERYLSARIRYATTLAKEDKLADMSQYLAAQRSARPDDAINLYLAQAEILREMDHREQAFDTLTEALAVHAGQPDLLYARALIAEKLDRLDVLERDLRIIIDADPENGHALNALGYTLADRTDRYQEALEYLQRAIVILPDDPAVLDSMGWVKYRLGNYDTSLEYLRRAYELNTDPEIASHLSEVLWATDQQQEAREVFERALKEHPDSEHLIGIRERLGL